MLARITGWQFLVAPNAHVTQPVRGRGAVVRGKVARRHIVGEEVRVGSRVPDEALVSVVGEEE